MASIKSSPNLSFEGDLAAWNQAYDRLQSYLNTFSLSDHAQVSRLTLKILDQARLAYQKDAPRDPTLLVMEQTQRLLAEWLEINLQTEGRTPQQIFASGYVAMLLSETFRTAPNAFLVSPLPEDLRQAMRRILVVTGPDLNVSSMTSREIDYGPMLELANSTWHQWNARSLLTALLFWSGVYLFFYCWITYFL